MQTPKWALVASVLVIASMLLGACAPTVAPTAAPAGTAVKVVETVVVTTAPQIQTQVVVATAEPTKAPEKKAVLRINQGSYPDIIDPQKSSFVGEIAHLHLIYEGLTRLNGKLETEPGAAEKWEYTDNGQTLTFTIRKGLKYSDGALLNAKRFEYSIMRNIDPTTAGEYAAITDDIAGAAEWRTADTAATSEEDMAKLKAAVEVHALDAAGKACKDAPDGYAQEDCLTLVVKTKAPAPYFHTVMSLWVTYPAKEENITDGGEQWWNSSKFQIGNGPFVLKTLEPFVRAYFVPNANYWKGQATYDIEYRYINDAAVAFEAYKNNEFDVVGWGAEDMAQIDADPNLKAQALMYPGSCTFAMMFHQQKAPFTDKKVREAFAYAIDRDAYNRDVGGGLNLSTLTWIPQGFPGFKEGETRWGFDPEAAKKAIAESSYGSVDKLPEIKLTFSDSPRNRTRMEWFAAQWQNVLGVTVTLDPVDPTTYTALTKDINTAPLAYILGWCADYPDPQNWLSVYWMTGGFAERIGYSNPALDEIMHKADAELDPAKRAELYQQAQDMLLDDAPVAFLYNNSNRYMVKPWVKGIVQTPQDSEWPGAFEPLSITIDTSMIP